MIREDERIETSPYASYVAHLREGRLAYQVTADGRPVFFPRVAAPGTGELLAWRVSRGLGTVYATTAMHARSGEPAHLALIDLDEGFRLMSRVEGIPALEVRIGLRVRFKAGEGTDGVDPYPLFTVLEEGQHD